MEWNFEPAMIFCNLNKFVNQLKIIEVTSALYTFMYMYCTMCPLILSVILQDFFRCVLEFLKLEKIEFGGMQGKHLSELVQQMFTNFQELMNHLSNKNYNPLVIDNEVHVQYIHVVMYMYCTCIEEFEAYMYMSILIIITVTFL